MRSGLWEWAHAQRHPVPWALSGMRTLGPPERQTGTRDTRECPLLTSDHRPPREGTCMSAGALTIVVRPRGPGTWAGVCWRELMLRMDQGWGVLTWTLQEPCGGTVHPRDGKARGPGDQEPGRTSVREQQETAPWADTGHGQTPGRQNRGWAVKRSPEEERVGLLLRLRRSSLG